MSGQFDHLGDDVDGAGIVKWVLAQLAIGAIDWMIFQATGSTEVVVAFTVFGEGVALASFSEN